MYSGQNTSLNTTGKTASLMMIPGKCWKIVNVMTSFKKVHFRDNFQKPVYPLGRDPNKSFLYDFLDWLEHWMEKEADTCKLRLTVHFTKQHKHPEISR